MHAGTMDGRHWLVVRRCLDDPDELTYYLVWAPPDTPLSSMVQAIGGRWHIEEDLHACKDLGLDHYEVRSYLGWYRHLTLVLLAYAFLVSITVQNHLTASTQPAASAACSPLIPLTTSEARHPAFLPDLPCAHLGSSALSMVEVSATPPILGWVLPSSPPRKSRLSLLAKLPGLPRTVPGSSPGKTPRSLSGSLSFLLHTPHERRAPMIFVSVAEASRRLGIDAKTLRGFLAHAQLPKPRHPHDGRKKGVSGEHLQVLARLHQRSLTPLPPEACPVPAPVAGQLPPLPAALLALPEAIGALQAQIAALQQVAELTCLLQQQAHPPVISAAPVPQTRALRRLARSTSPAPRSRPATSAATKPPLKQTHVLPRVEYSREGCYVVICPKQGLLPFEPDTPEWFAWVAKQSSFRFVGKLGRLTAHHEWRVPRGAWRAHRHLRNYSYTLRLASSQELTIAVLEQAAEALQAHLR
jgi:hypothetical protein